MSESNEGTKKWSREQLKLAFHLYCQLPFGKLHSRNPEILELAGIIGRTPGALAMKLVNFASLDPAITESGRVGLSGASRLDREIWSEFSDDWDGLTLQCVRLRQELGVAPANDEADVQLVPEDYSGETRRVITEQRIGQSFFRRAVLSSYGGRCCMSGVAESQLLIASHIVPWGKDKANRLNPRNGLCLSAIHDRAFDKGLISVSLEYQILVSASLLESKNEFIVSTFANLEGRHIELPERFRPDREFLARHRAEVFVGG
jgi:putative restriction endonuclease